MLERIRSSVVAVIATGVISGAMTPSRLAAQNIEPSGPPIAAFTNVGLGWYADVGQTFLAGGSYMNSFSFWFGSSAQNWLGGSGLSGVALIPYIMAWDGDNVVGNPLFQGTTTVVSGLTEFQRFDFSTGDLALSPNTTYIAFVQAVNDGVHTGNVGVGFSDVSGTGAVANNLQGSPADPLTQPWDITDAGLSVTFAASFSNTPVTATPEPATLMLVATGVAGLAGSARFRRKR